MEGRQGREAKKLQYWRARGEAGGVNWVEILVVLVIAVVILERILICISNAKPKSPLEKHNDENDPQNTN